MEMRSASLTDLDPPAAAEQRWPYYIVWTLGALVVAAVLLSRMPPATAHPALTPDVAAPVQIVPARP